MDEHHPLEDKTLNEPQNGTPPTEIQAGDGDTNSASSHGLRNALVIIGVILFFTLPGAAVYFFINRSQTPTTNYTQNSASPTVSVKTATGLQLDPQKDYGNKYADGILPVGDGKYVTDSAKKGYIYLCHANFVPASQAGAQTRGPWFIGTDEWDINKKVHVSGSVDWDERLSMEVKNGQRLITTNDLPNHHTGVFPVSIKDLAYNYDRNPNAISEQDLSYALSASPEYGEPECMGGEAGIMLTGAALFDGFDAGGRDAGAWEVQDTCEGHPQAKGEYHYHTLSSCITDIAVNKVIGFALDGFPITGPKVGDNNMLTSNDLDECHGLVSDIDLDGKTVNSYHYVMTQDFPYSVSCFRSKPIQAPGLDNDKHQI